MAPEVFFTVCYGTANVPDEVAKRYDFKPAVLHGYCRRRVRGEDYPGMTADKHHKVRGTLATGLTEEDVRNLDRFEGGDYDRILVKVRVLEEDKAPAGGEDEEGEGGKSKAAPAAAAAAAGNVEGEEVDQCMTYVMTSTEYLEDREWDFVEFRQEKLKKWTRFDFIFNGSSLHGPPHSYHWLELTIYAEALDESNRHEGPAST